jgi:hypothetical protein
MGEHQRNALAPAAQSGATAANASNATSYST